MRQIKVTLILGCSLLAAGCQPHLDQSDPAQLNAAAEVVLLPHVVEERRAEILGILEESTLPPSIKIPAMSGEPTEEARAARVVLSQVGASGPDIHRRIAELSQLFNGITERPLSSGELQKIEPWLNARMHWAVVDGSLLLGRGEGEVGQLTGGLNLSKSPGLTRHGASMVREMVNPVLERWKVTPVDGFAPDVRYIAALFGARESVEAAVVIFSVLTAIGMAGTGRVRGGKIAAGVIFAAVLAVATGLLWNALIHAGTLGGGKQTIFIAFGALSIAMFLLIGSAIFHPIYFGKWMSKLREIGKGNPGGAAFLIAFLAVYREGFEMSLSMTTLSMMGGWDAVLQGLGAGIPAGLLMIAAGWKIQRGWIGVRGMLIASGGMMVLASASFAALFVNYLEQQGSISPIYLVKDIPVSLTVFTGLSGSLQTLLAFLAVAGVLILPWMIRRARNLEPGGGMGSIGVLGGRAAWVGVAKVGAGVAILALVGVASRQVKVEEIPEPVEAVTWAYALEAANKGVAVLVDSRETGSEPAIDGAIGLPLDNDDGSIKEFCEFAGEGKDILVFGDGDQGEAMARRIFSLCGRRVKSVLPDGAGVKEAQ